jgi:hypothetical protein
MQRDGIDTVRLRAADLRARAGQLRILISDTVDAEVIRQLSKLADEYDLLANAVEALDPDDKEG